MTSALETSAFLQRLSAFCANAGLFRVHPDQSAPTARATLEALAGLPHWEAIWSGDLEASVVLLLAMRGERLAPGEIERRTTLLHQRAAVLGERVQGPIRALQLLVYERPLEANERDNALAGGRRGGVLSRHKVGTWIVSLHEPAVHARRYGGWPAELSSEKLQSLLFTPSAQPEESAPAP